MTENRGLVREV